jgi:glycine/D-amino acid oxidase-like deaminating enzyme
MALIENDSLSDAKPISLWIDSAERPSAEPALAAAISTDLLVVGGGLTGLWTAVLAADADPGRDIVLIESHEVAYGASGRNGGFFAESLTHGIAHGLSLWPNEIDQLLRLGRENVAQIVQFLRDEGIAVGLSLQGKSLMAVLPHQVAELKLAHEMNLRFGEKSILLNQEQTQADIASPTYLGSLRTSTGSGLLDPARLCWGLKAAAIKRGVKVFENTKALHLETDSHGVLVKCATGSVRARQAVLATNAFPPLVGSIRRRVLPLYDHVLASQPLSEAQLSAIGWLDRQGATDAGNQFHYYRLTPDNRILWGGYDAIYYFGNKTEASREQRESSFQLLAAHFFQTFPQLEDLKFTHRWAGLIDSTTRFTPYFGMNRDRNLTYPIGYTGLGVASSRFGAKVSLDLLSGVESELTALEMVRKKPVPFPPEPLRFPTVQYTRHALAHQDSHGGRRGIWLSLLDRFGIGFNS